MTHTICFMDALFGQQPTPLPVPITPVEQVSQQPGDVLLTWTDATPINGMGLYVALGCWAFALLVYGCWRLFVHQQPEGED